MEQARAESESYISFEEESKRSVETSDGLDLIPIKPDCRITLIGNELRVPFSLVSSLFVSRSIFGVSRSLLAAGSKQSPF